MKTHHASHVRAASAVALGALALGTSVTLSAQSQVAADALQPWQAVTYQHLTSLEPSPDGERLAFLRSKPRRPLDEDSGPAWVEIWMMHHGGEPAPFVTGEVTASALRWIDAERLAFIAKREGDEHDALYVIAATGGEARRAETNHRADPTQSAASPNSRSTRTVSLHSPSRRPWRRWTPTSVKPEARCSARLAWLVVKTRLVSL